MFVVVGRSCTDASFVGICVVYCLCCVCKLMRILRGYMCVCVCLFVCDCVYMYLCVCVCVVECVCACVE